MVLEWTPIQQNSGYFFFFSLWEPEIKTNYRAVETTNHISTKWPRESHCLFFKKFIKFT